MSVCKSSCNQPKLTRGYNLRAYLGQTYTNAEGQTVPIPPEEWEAFISVIAAAFPDGFTIYDALGGYAFDGQTFTEPSKVLEVIAPKSKQIIVKFAKLVNTYTVEFKQSSQLWTVQRTRYFSG